MFYFKDIRVRPKIRIDGQSRGDLELKIFSILFSLEKNELDNLILMIDVILLSIWAWF